MHWTLRAPAAIRPEYRRDDAAWTSTWFCDEAGLTAWFSRALLEIGRDRLLNFKSPALHNGNGPSTGWCEKASSERIECYGEAVQQA
jgi:hypothetical protein